MREEEKEIERERERETEGRKEQGERDLNRASFSLLAHGLVHRLPTQVPSGGLSKHNTTT